MRLLERKLIFIVNMTGKSFASEARTHLSVIYWEWLQVYYLNK